MENKARGRFLNGEESKREIWKWRRNQEGIFVNGGQARRIRQQWRDL
jgi:hypothetical protein